MADMEADNMAREMTPQERADLKRLHANLLKSINEITPMHLGQMTTRMPIVRAHCKPPAERRCWRWPNCTKNGEMANTAGHFSDLLRHKLAQEG